MVREMKKRENKYSLQSVICRNNGQQSSSLNSIVESSMIRQNFKYLILLYDKN